MASPNTSYSEIITTTIQNRSRKLADNMSDNNAILLKMKQKGRIKTVSGGNTILQELAYADNATGMWYSGYEQLSVAVSEVFSAAEFNYKQLAAAVVMSGLEMLQNSGKERMIDLITARVDNAEKTLKNMISAGMYADGTGTNSKEIGGLQHIVADTNTNTVGGISGTTYSWWRNVAHDVSDAGSTLSTTTVQDHMNRLWVQLVRGTDHPDLILADNTNFRLFLGSLQPIQRLTNPDLARLGFTNLQYINADVVLDGGIGGACPSSHFYFLNTDYLHFRPHADRNLVPLDPDRYSTNQDAVVKLIGWAGNMTTSGRQFQGVMKT